MATIRKRGAYQWQAIVRRKGYPQQSKTFETRKNAESWARKIERDIEAGHWRDSGEADRTTLAECLQRYIDEISSKKKSGKQEFYKANCILKHPVSNMYMSNIRSVDIADYRKSRESDDLAPSTIQKEMALLSHLFNVARKEWGMESLKNPVQDVSNPKVSNARDRRLEGDEEQRLLEACSPRFHNSNPWLLPLVQLAIETAMRQGELLDLQWKDIDIKKQILKCRNKDPKGKDLHRYVPLSRKACGIFTSLPRSMDGRTFPTSQNAIKLAFNRARERAGMADFRFHDLRHEATSRLFEKGLDPMEVSTITGHKTLQMLKRYTHLRAQDLVKKLG